MDIQAVAPAGMKELCGSYVSANGCFNRFEFDLNSLKADLINNDIIEESESYSNYDFNEEMENELYWDFYNQRNHIAV
jgi:hypothetical protein